MRRTLAFLAALLVSDAMLADDTLWTRLWSPGHVARNASVQCRGTDALVAGSVFDTATKSSDIFVAKYSAAGSKIWNKTLNFDASDDGGTVAVGPDNCPYVGLSSGRTPTARIVKLNTTGDTVWTRSKASTYSGPLVADNANNVYGLFSTGTLPNDSLLLIGYNATGTLTAYRTLKLGRAHQPSGLCLVGTHLIAASNIADSLVTRAALVKFTTSGETVWTRVLPESLATSALAIAGEAGGDFYLLGYRPAGPVMARLNPGGDTVWTVTISTSDPLSPSLATDTAGNIFLATGGQACRLYKYDSQGRFLATLRAIVGYPIQTVSVSIGTDDMPVATGPVVISPQNVPVLTVKFANPAGGVAKPAVPYQVPNIRVQPNPVTRESATVRILGSKSSRAQRASVTVFDVSGRPVLHHPSIWNPVLGIALDLRNVSAGVYLVKVEANGFTQTQKLVVQ